MNSTIPFLQFLIYFTTLSLLPEALFSEGIVCFLCDFLCLGMSACGLNDSHLCVSCKHSRWALLRSLTGLSFASLKAEEGKV